MSANHSHVLLGGMLLCPSEPDARRGSSGGLPEDRGALSVVLVLSCGVVIGIPPPGVPGSAAQPLSLALSSSTFCWTFSLRSADFSSLSLRLASSSAAIAASSAAAISASTS